MADIKESLRDWLRDAHAMETQAVEMLERQSERLKNYPELLAKVQEHTEVSRRQADRVRDCLKILGTDTSSIKSGVAALIGNAQSLSGVFVGDEAVKGAIFSLSFEHFEIANYRALATTAEVAGEPEIKRLVEENLREEEEMARWLESNLATITRTYLQRKAADMAEAKR